MKTSSHSADQLMQLQRTSYAFIFHRIFTDCRVLIFLEVSQHDPHSLWTFKTRVFSFSLSFSFLKNLQSLWLLQSHMHRRVQSFKKKKRKRSSESPPRVCLQGMELSHVSNLVWFWLHEQPPSSRQRKTDCGG